jgi:hypothetical protein
VHNIWKQTSKRKTFFSAAGNAAQARIPQAVAKEIVSTCVEAMIGDVKELSCAASASLVKRSGRK